MAFYDEDMQCQEQIEQQWQEMSAFVAQLLCGNGIPVIKRHRRLARAGKRTLCIKTNGIDCTLVWRHPSNKRVGALPLCDVTEVTREGAVVTLHSSNRPCLMRAISLVAESEAAAVLLASTLMSLKGMKSPSSSSNSSNSGSSSSSISSSKSTARWFA
jgi:hypothetical protein